MAAQARTFDELFPELLQSFCDDMGYRFHSAYSGRGMYGDTCPGISHSEDAFTLGVQLTGFMLETLADHDAGEIVQEMLDVARRARSDSLGMGSILYFPGQ